MGHSKYTREFYMENVFVHYKTLAWRLYHITQDPYLAEEFAQEAMRIAWEQLEQLREPQNAKAWLLKIGDNLAARHFRNNASRKTTSLETAALSAIEDESADILEGLLRRETFQAMWAAMEKLDVKYRRIIQLYYYEEMSLKEIARVLGQNYNTTRVQHHRGILELRKLMDDTEE
ncbi:MAG: RNA polymerase sigma factor [Bacillota bacterium]|nr:RNA polymerase sigma factor [Bacillota bacterium]